MSLHPNYESITVSTTAVGLTAATYSKHRIAVITVEAAAIRFRVDGTNPTASEGHEVEDGGRITLFSADDIFNFRAIRRDGTDAKLRVSYGDGSESLTLTNPAAAGSVSIGTVTIDNGTGASAVPVRGAEAADAVAAQNPVRIAGRGYDTAPADVSADGDVTEFWLDRNGSLNVILRDDAGAPVSVGGGTQYNEDDAHTTGDKVTGAGVVRKDTPTSLAGADGDYSLLIVDADGRLHVNAAVASSALPTGAATDAKLDTIIGHVDGLETLLTAIEGHVDTLEASNDAIKTASELLDDAVYTDNGAWTNDVSKHLLVGGLYQSTPQAVTDGRVAPVQIDSTGRLIVAVDSLPTLPAGTNNIGDVDVLTLPADPLGTNADAAVAAGGTGSISGKLRQMSSDISAIKTAVQLIDDGVSGTEFQVDIVTMPSLPAGTNNIGDVDLASAIPAGTNLIGSVKISDGADELLIDASGNIGVTDAGGSLTVDNADISAAATSLAIIDDALVADDAPFAPASTKVAMAGFTFDDTAPDSVNEGDAGAARMSANRNQYVQIRDNAGNERGLNIDAAGAIAVTNTDIAAIKTAVEIMDDWDETDRARVNIVVGQAGVSAGAGAVAANTPRVTHASDDPVTTAVQLLDDAVFTDDAAFTPGTSKGLAVGLQADETSPDSVNEADFGVPRMTLERFQVVTPRPTSTGEGLDTYSTIDLDESEEEVKSSAGKVYGWYFQNLSASARYVRFYDNTAAGTTVGTTTAKLVFAIPTGTGQHIALDHGIPFATGICIAATTGIAANDTGAPAANDVVGWVVYK